MMKKIFFILIFAFVINIFMTKEGIGCEHTTHSGSWVENIESPLLRNFVGSEMVGVPFSAVTGGLFEYGSGGSFWHGAWDGAKSGFVSSGISAIGASVQYSYEYKVNIITGRSTIIMQTSITGTISREGLNIPDNWIEKPANKSDGIIYQDPNNKHNSIRIMPGNPNSPNPAQQQPYIIYRQNGAAYDVSGNRLSTGRSPKAHIPIVDFDANKMPKFK
jgi:hypothetical protein